MINQAKMAQMGEMIGGITHQWRQLLNILNLILQDIEEIIQDEEINRSEVIEQIEESYNQIGYMSNTMNDFRTFFIRIGKKRHLRFMLYPSKNKHKIREWKLLK